MCGGIELYERTLATRKFRAIAMSVLASGALEPGEAIEYLARQPNVEAIVFGASTRANISQTRQVIEKAYFSHSHNGENVISHPRRKFA